MSVEGYFVERFGIPGEAFLDYAFWKTTHDYGIISKNALSSALYPLVVYSLGIVVLREIGRYLKPTTHALQIFGHLARRNVVDLDHQTILELLDNKIASVRPSLEPGYVILAYQGDVLGCGLAIHDRLRHQFPQWVVSALIAAMKGLYRPSVPKK